MTGGSGDCVGGGDAHLFHKIQERSRMQYPNSVGKFIGYGTAGFRDKASMLSHVMFRVGIISGLRSKQKNGATIGVMITASHNPEEDNGVKLVDPQGEMLENAWEALATEVANLPDDKLASSLETVIKDYSIDINGRASIFIGRDTRKSSPSLCQAVLDGIACLPNVDVVDYELCSTPLLHYLVVCRNGNEGYGKCSKVGYYDKLTSAFCKIMVQASTPGKYKPDLTLDCANGVGSNMIRKMETQIKPSLQLCLVNNGGGILNHDCGADFVKVQQTFPENVKPTPGQRFASLDGDADRLIYYYFDDNSTFHMLDGDKIALLFAKHFSDLAKEAKLNLRTGIVQTAYANGSSTNYATDVLRIPVSCVPTGVKHLHAAAHEYDIGVYFEANGHGTVLFSDNAVASVRSAASKGNKAAVELACFLDIINSTVGDAISDMLGVEAVLNAKGWDAEEWDKMYTDLPNRQLKVCVGDRNVIKTTDAERKCVSPSGLQERVDTLVKGYRNGRSFVRPSGTEDIVRIYAEADTQANSDALCKEVALAVYELCGGVGAKP